MPFFLLIFHVFVIPSLHFQHLRSIASVVVTILIFAHLPFIKFPHDLHNSAFNIVFLPLMPHGSFLLDGFCRDMPNFTHHNLCFHQIHYQAFTLKCTFPSVSFFAVPPCSPLSNLNHPRVVFLVTCPLISFVATSITMASNSGDKTDPWCTPMFTSALQ